MPLSLSRSPIAVCTIFVLHSEGDDLENCPELLSHFFCQSNVLLSLHCLRHSWMFFLKTVWSHSE